MEKTHKKFPQINFSKCFNPLQKKLFLSTALFLSIYFFPQAQIKAQELLLNLIIATVDNQPITLHELNSVLDTKVENLDAVKKDAQAQQALNTLIFQKVVAAEAEKRKITAEPSEIERYLVEVASRNGLTLPDFEKALIKEGKNIDKFKNEVKTEIFRSKIAGYLIQEGVAVNDQEITDFLTNNPQLEGPGVKVHIKQILLEVSEKRDQETALALMKNIKEQIDLGSDFETLAARYSEAPEGKDGGDLGILDEADLNPLIKSAIENLEDEQLSEPNVSPVGVHMFKLVKRYENEVEAYESVRNEAKEYLKRQKLTKKVGDFFSKDIMEAHAVEKKI